MSRATPSGPFGLESATPPHDSSHSPSSGVSNLDHMSMVEADVVGCRCFRSWTRDWTCAARCSSVLGSPSSGLARKCSICNRARSFRIICTMPSRTKEIRKGACSMCISCVLSPHDTTVLALLCCLICTLCASAGISAMPHTLASG